METLTKKKTVNNMTNNSQPKKNKRPISSLVGLAIWATVTLTVLANNTINAYPLTTAVMVGKFYNQTGKLNLSEAIDLDRVLYRHGVFNSPDKFYKLVRQMSNIPQILDFQIRELGESKSNLIKTVVIMRLINGVDIDGTPVDNKNKTITVGGD